MMEHQQSKHITSQIIYIVVGIFLVLVIFLAVLAGPFHKLAGDPESTVAVIGIPSILVITAVVWLLWRERSESKTSGFSSSLLKDELIDNNFILDAMTEAVIVLDARNIIIAFNKAAAALTEWPAEEAVGLDYRSVITFAGENNTSTDQKDVVAKSIGEAKKLNTTANIISKTKKTILTSLSVSPILDKDQLLSGALIVMRDITEETTAQQRKADFVSTASHEMRTPVAAIEGYLALAMNDKVSTIDERARDFLIKAHAGTESLGKLFRDLLTSEKADDERLSYHPVVLDMGKFLETTVESLKFLAQKKALNVEFVIGASKVLDTKTPQRKTLPPLLSVYADPDRLREVVTNLFDNAVKYTNQGKIIVGLTGDEQNVQFYVKDTGMGISREDLPHIFQKFYRVDNTQTQVISGTGLGLFIAGKMVELCKGKIWAESETGKGSTFFVTLPRLSQQQADQLNKQGPNEAGSIVHSASTS